METIASSRASPCDAPIQLVKGSEPIPGYQFVERLGSGGYGEVWKVNAPGGLAKAIKIIFGDMEGPRAEQELRALERIKSVRHPFLLSLERFEIVSGQLLIVTELADRSLMQRFVECRDSGLPGIPRDELLNYVREAADALDYLNETHGLQHLDIKPENLLLVGTHIKVADFGLVKNLLGNSASMTGGVTPIYATPEAFDGRVSRFSDQYSLAIVYQEMLTGQRPFNGTTPFQLVAQHTTAQPELSSLPVNDRPAIARALAKIPDQRFPLCRHLVEALSATPRQDGERPPPPPPPLQPALERSLVKTAVAGVPPPADVRKTLFTPRQPAPQQKNTEGALSPILGTGSGEFILPASMTSYILPRRAGVAKESFLVPAAPATSAQSEVGVRPTLFVGLGGLAGNVLRQLKQRLLEATPGTTQAKLSGLFRYLLVDTDRSALRTQEERPEDGALTADECLHCPLFPPDHYRDQAQHLIRWLPRRWLYGIPRSLQTEGLRPLGRLAIVSHAEALVAALQQALSALANPESRDKRVGPIRNESPQVVVVAAITGGAGGGMLVDVARAVRQVFHELRLPDEIRAMLLSPNGGNPEQQTRARINAYATLQELWHWCQPAWQTGPSRGSVFGTFQQPPFDDCYVVLPPEELSADVTRQVVEYLSFDATIGGGRLEQMRNQSREGHPACGMTIRGCGLASVRFPRHQLIEAASDQLSRQLVESWRGEVSSAESQRIGARAKDHLREKGVSEDHLQQRILGRIPKVLTPSADQLHEQLTNAQAPSPAPGSPQALQFLSRIDEDFGTGAEADAVLTTGKSAVELAFREEGHRVAGELAAELIGELVKLVETPQVRLRGAEVTVEALSAQLQSDIHNVRDNLDRVSTARRVHRRHLEGQAVRESSLLTTRMRRLFREHAGDRHLRQYLCLRIEELVQDTVLTVLGVLRSRLTGWGLELAQARRGWHELLSAFPPADLSGRSEDGGSLAFREIWPYEAKNAPEALAKLLERLPSDLPRQFDRLVQLEVLEKAGGLWGVLSGDSAKLGAGIRERLRERASLLVGDCLDEVNVPYLLLDHTDEGALLRQVVEHTVATARQASGREGTHEQLVLAIPQGKGSKAVSEEVQRVLEGQTASLLEAGETWLVVHETSGVSLAKLAARVAGDDPGVVELAQKVLTRHDVNWTPF